MIDYHGRKSGKYVNLNFGYLRFILLPKTICSTNLHQDKNFVRVGSWFFDSFRYGWKQVIAWCSQAIRQKLGQHADETGRL